MDKIYEKYGVDLTILKRDYIKYPLLKEKKKNRYLYEELPYKEDLEYLLCELKLSKTIVSNILGISFVKLGRVMKQMNIRIYKDRPYKNYTDDFYDKFNVDKTKLKRDYIENPLILKRGKSSNEKPYKEDLDYFLSLKIYIKDIASYFGVKEGCVEKWMNFYGLHTNIKEVSCRKVNKSKDIVKKYNIDLTKLSRDYVQIPLVVVAKRNPVGYIVEIPSKDDLEYLFIELNMSRKDVAKYFNVSESQVKLWNRNYGIKKNLEDIQRNIIKTMVDVGKPFDSNEEKIVYEKLCTVFSDVRCHYWSEKYPYFCDFYIPEIDTYIEYQGYGGGHNNRPYMGINEDLIELEFLRDRAKHGHKMSQRMLNAWGNKDIVKRNVAKKNGLKYLEFFNMKQFDDWFQKLLDKSK